MNEPSITTKARVTCIAAATLMLAACSGGDGSSISQPPPPPPPPPPPFDATFSAIQENVFTVSCATAGCHQGAGAPQGLILDEANSFALLVDVPSMEVPAILRVAPGDPDNSYLIQKLEGTATVGGQMPLGRTPLAQETIDVVRQWITDGATDDREPSPDPIRVTALVPVPDSELDAAPTEVVAMFDREIDVSTVNAMTFLLEASGGDGTFDDGNETAITGPIATPAMNPMSASLDLAAATLDDDYYRVRLLGSGASVIMDIDANALDGEFAGTFPSGDGIAGGDFEATFSIVTPMTGFTFDEIQTNVFTPTCATAGCHQGAGAPQGLRLEEGMSFDLLVNVASNEVPTLLRVEPGNPDDSYLVQKIEGTAAVGGRMPLGRPPLDQATIDGVRQWIADGANR